MSTNGTTNGDSKAQSSFDENFTKSVNAATGPKANPRIKQLIAGLTTHLHDFVRENQVTIDEWMLGLDYLNQAGKMSDERRNESQLLSDILGLESLVDDVTYQLASKAKDAPTATAILGPFWRKDAPRRKMGDSIVMNEIPDGDHTKMHGLVTDFKTGKPIEGAELDIWHTAPNGLYEQQDPDQPDMNLRGRYTTGPDGKYTIYCLRPTPYPIPSDGPSGKLLEALDRHPMRPAHIHFIISAPGYRPIVTQIFDRRDKYIDNDAVFAVKDSLITDFLPLEGDSKADFELPYNFKLASYEDAEENGTTSSTGHVETKTAV